MTLHSVHDSFEALVVKLITGCGRTNIAVLYRLPSSSVDGAPVGTFYDQLLDFQDEALSLPGELMLCGYLNCARVDPERVVLQLEDLLFLTSRVTWCIASEALHMLLVIYWTSSSPPKGQRFVYC